MRTSALDNPMYSALTQRHSHLAARRGRAVRYPGDVAPFSGLPPEPTAQDWADLAALHTGGPSLVMVARAGVPHGWHVVGGLRAHQMVGAPARRPGARPRQEARALAGRAGVEVVDLGDDDAGPVSDLAARADLGLFRPAALRAGSFVGVRRHGRLLAMASTRMALEGWTEISAVATDPDARGQGLATVVTAHVAAEVRASGQRPFLHVEEGNPARGLYERLGFTVRALVVGHFLSPPQPARPPTMEG